MGYAIAYVGIGKMNSPDIIRHTLARPLDWSQFEKIVGEVLAQDDLPDLRVLGGVADGGADALEEQFYEDGVRTAIVVQVTSDTAQLAKFNKTVKRLESTRKKYDQLIIVYRGIVATSVRTAIQLAATKKGIAVDIRDEDYLVRHLGRAQNGIFKRYFGTAREQIAFLLNEQDSFALADGKLRRALLASIGAYVTNPASRLLRTTLFDRTVLAALVVVGCDSSIARLKAQVAEAVVGEDIGEHAIREALGRLQQAGLCRLSDQKYYPTDASLESVGATLAAVATASQRMRDQVLGGVSEHHKLNDAQKGRIERNLKRSLAGLFRRVGPTLAAADDMAGVLTNDDVDITTTMGADLPASITQSAIVALNAVVRDPINVELLAKFARSYAALAVRNVDPLGRKFQQEALAKSVLVLDTDAVLTLIIEDVPEHLPLKQSLVELQKVGVKIVVPEEMLREAFGHISRARRSYLRVAGSLGRLPGEYVDAEVWNIVVRGFYYHLANGGHDDFQKYWHGFYETERGTEFLEFILLTRVPLEIQPVQLLDGQDAGDFEQLLPQVLERKEQRRKKAEYRDDEQMKTRTEIDLRCALDVARRLTSASFSGPKGYLVSADSAFSYLQSLDEWAPRPRVHLHTSCVAELAEFACGLRLNDDQIVRAVFNPIHIAAAEQLKSPLSELARAGVDLREVGLQRLEWDITNELRSTLTGYEEAIKPGGSAAERVEAGLALSMKAVNLGYTIDTGLAEVIKHYYDLKARVFEESSRRAQAEQVAQKLIDGASGLTKKGKRRVRKILHDVGGTPPRDEDVDGTTDE